MSGDGPQLLHPLLEKRQKGAGQANRPETSGPLWQATSRSFEKIFASTYEMPAAHLTLHTPAHAISEFGECPWIPSRRSAEKDFATKAISPQTGLPDAQVPNIPLFSAPREMIRRWEDRRLTRVRRFPHSRPSSPWPPIEPSRPSNYPPFPDRYPTTANNLPAHTIPHQRHCSGGHTDPQ